MPYVLCLRKRTGIFSETLNEAGIGVGEAPANWARNPRRWRDLGRYLAVQNPAVVHSQLNFSLVQQFLAVRLFTNARFFVTERNCYPLTGWARMRRMLQFYFLKLFGVGYSANSEDVADYLARQVRFPRKNIPVIHNGITVPSIDPAVRARLRKQYEWSEGDFVAGYIGRFASHKGQRYFLQVLKEARKQGGDRIKGCFIGDGPEKEEVMKLAEALGLAQQVVFTGVISNVEEYLQAFDALLLLSDYEGMPNVVLEGMAAGLPVISNPVGNAARLLDGGAGLVNKSEDPIDTAKLLLAVAESPSKAHGIGVRARERVKNEFSLEATLYSLSVWYCMD